MIGAAGLRAACHLAARHRVRDVVPVEERTPLSLASANSAPCHRGSWPGPGSALLGLMNRSRDPREGLTEGAATPSAGIGGGACTPRPIRPPSAGCIARRCGWLRDQPLGRCPPGGRGSVGSSSCSRGSKAWRRRGDGPKQLACATGMPSRPTASSAPPAPSETGSARCSARNCLPTRYQDPGYGWLLQSWEETGQPRGAARGSSFPGGSLRRVVAPGGDPTAARAGTGRAGPWAASGPG